MRIVISILFLLVSTETYGRFLDYEYKNNLVEKCVAEVDHPYKNEDCEISAAASIVCNYKLNLEPKKRHEWMSNQLEGDLRNDFLECFRKEVKRRWNYGK